jgi:hypothetical protein
MTATRDRTFIGFASLGVAALLVEWAVTRSAAFARGGAVPIAVFVDLMLVLPLLYFLVVLRPARRPLLDAAPALAVGALVAGILLAARPETKTLLRFGGALAEVAVMALLVRRLRLAARQLRGADGDDLLLRIAALTDPVLRVLGLELAVMYYAFAGPRVRRPLREGEFGYVEKSGAGGLLFALGLVVTMEGVSLHFLLHAWSATAAWIHAAVDVYAMIWLAAAYQAARLRPVAVSADRLLVRTSLLWTLEVPRDAIAGVTRIQEMPRAKGVLRAAFGAAPELLVTLSRPVVARGPLGLRRTVTAIALYVDEPEGLRAALAR